MVLLKLWEKPQIWLLIQWLHFFQSANLYIYECVNMWSPSTTSVWLMANWSASFVGVFKVGWGFSLGVSFTSSNIPEHWIQMECIEQFFLCVPHNNTMECIELIWLMLCIWNRENHSSAIRSTSDWSVPAYWTYAWVSIYPAGLAGVHGDHRTLRGERTHLAGCFPPDRVPLVP